MRLLISMHAISRRRTRGSGEASGPESGEERRRGSRQQLEAIGQPR